MSRYLRCRLGLLLAAVLPSAGCSSSDDSSTDPFSSETTGVFLQVAYAPGAEPYTGGAGQLSDYWALTRDNLGALFGDKTIRVPSVLAEMSTLAPGGDDAYSVAEILDLAETVPDDSRDGEARFIALWLDGYYEAGGEARRDVLGVAIGGTNVVAMFKPVIALSEGVRSNTVAAFVEQSTLVHEVGHAIGLVNNGLPLTSDHHDEANGAHCTNRDCVMYYLNEGVLDLRDFVQDFIATGDTILFGEQCLADVRAAM